MDSSNKPQQFKDIIAGIKSGSRERYKRIRYELFSDEELSNCMTVWKYIGKTFMRGKDSEAEYNTAEYLSLIHQLIYYTHGLEDKFTGNLKAGILLSGVPGVGKTTLFRIMDEYRKIDNVHYVNEFEKKRLPFSMHIQSSRKMVADYVENGYEGINLYFVRSILCIDDLGSEETESKHYGTVCQVVNEIIERRYISGLLTHVSTNLDVISIREKYGDRVYSRLKEMCNRYEVKGKDKRG